MKWKGDEVLETIRLLQQAIDYVEHNLNSAIEIEDIATAAMTSKFHFQRMFHALTGFTVTEYVRNRRLTLAAEELAGTDNKVIDIALNYGYETPEAFAKAFQRMHGVTPHMAKKKNVKLKSFPRISFQIQIKGETEMNYRIVEEQASTIIGKDVIIQKDAYTEIPIFVEGIWKDGTHDRINDLVGKPSGSLLYGYYFDFREDGTKRYLMGTDLPDGKEVTEGLVTLHVPGQTYAVFDSRESIPDDSEIGLEIQNVWRRIYSEWFPSVGFEQVEGPCMEKYFWMDDTQEESICEVWIPVRRKI
ncbi:effector binding domain-containing protein [Paenibacillus sp. RS8]